jgi:ribulose-phosphate 3-epimerase
MKNRSLNEMKFEHSCLVAPSILAADFSRLGEAISSVEEGGADLLHVDIMDGHFVPNLSMGPGVVSCIRKGSDLPFDVHLMLSEPGRYIEPFAKAGADHITVHVESRGDLADVIRRIHDLGCSAGVTLRPGTPATSLRPYLDMVEMVLVMTVEPGFGGQSFMEGQLPKIASLRKMIDATGKKIYLEVDGGVAVGTARQVKAAGADVLVAGSSVFGAKNGFAAAIKAVREDA